MREALAVIVFLVSTPVMAQVSCELLSEYDRAASTNFRGMPKLAPIPGATECALFEDEYNTFQCTWESADQESDENVYKSLVNSVQSCFPDVVVDAIKDSPPLRSARFFTKAAVFYLSIGTNSADRPSRILFDVQQR